MRDACPCCARGAAAPGLPTAAEAARNAPWASRGSSPEHSRPGATRSPAAQRSGRIRPASPPAAHPPPRQRPATRGPPHEVAAPRSGPVLPAAGRAPRDSQAPSSFSPPRHAWPTHDAAPAPLPAVLGVPALPRAPAGGMRGGESRLLVGCGHGPGALHSPHREGVAEPLVGHIAAACHLGVQLVAL